MPLVAVTSIALCLAAWATLLIQHQEMADHSLNNMWMPPTDAWQWSTTDFAIIFTMWSVMMAAMMLPSALPMIKAYSRVARQRYRFGFPYSLLFKAAYLLVWLIFSVLLTLIQWQLHHRQGLTPMMDNNSPLLATSIFFIAGLYQFSALKHTCLQHCRSTIGFLMHHWRNDLSGAFTMGFIHGLYCLGCCWAQMLIMFAVGVMNLSAMVLLTVFFIVEKNLPVNTQFVSRIAGVLLCFWGIGVLIAFHE